MLGLEMTGAWGYLFVICSKIGRCNLPILLPRDLSAYAKSLSAQRGDVYGLDGAA